MRDSYHESLESVVTDLVNMSDAVQTAVRVATIALLEADLATAESGDLVRLPPSTDCTTTSKPAASPSWLVRHPWPANCARSLPPCG